VLRGDQARDAFAADWFWALTRTRFARRLPGGRASSARGGFSGAGCRCEQINERARSAGRLFQLPLDTVGGRAHTGLEVVPVLADHVPIDHRRFPARRACRESIAGAPGRGIVFVDAEDGHSQLRIIGKAWLYIEHILNMEGESHASIDRIYSAIPALGHFGVGFWAY
jgi:hypothetical protein